jgi:hypothetical protein
VSSAVSENSTCKTSSLMLKRRGSRSQMKTPKSKVLLLLKAGFKNWWNIPTTQVSYEYWLI